MGVLENNNYLIVNQTCNQCLSNVKKKSYERQSNFALVWSSALDFKWKWLLPAVLAFVCYINGLHGDFVHDDKMAIKKNIDVIGTTSLTDVFLHDFWGRQIASNSSHKSYRPVTVLTFR